MMESISTSTRAFKLRPVLSSSLPSLCQNENAIIREKNPALDLWFPKSSVFFFMIQFSYDHLLKTYCHAEGISRFWEMQTWRNTNICRYIHIYALWYVCLCWLRREKPIVSAMEETRSLCSWVKQRGLQEHMLLTLSVSYIPSKQKGRVRNRRVRVAYVQRPAMAISQSQWAQCHEMSLGA